MAHHTLSANFSYFFSRINPSDSFQKTALREHQTITSLIEASYGLASELSPKCFLQGSYKQETAIYTINDVDIVVLCCALNNPIVPGSLGSLYGKNWTRDMIFNTIAAPLLNDGRYRDKVKYHNGSMCIKVDLGIKIEILPVVFKTGNSDPSTEPFRLYRPETQQWEDGYARYHQTWLTLKNQSASGNFIPSIKVLKHLRSRLGLQAVSFHIECLLFRLPDQIFSGSPADYIMNVLSAIASIPAENWYHMTIKTPCDDRDIFTTSEWDYPGWENIHKNVVTWSTVALLANQEANRNKAIEYWQLLLGNDFFPYQVSQ